MSVIVRAPSYYLSRNTCYYFSKPARLSNATNPVVGIPSIWIAVRHQLPERKKAANAALFVRKCEGLFLRCPPHAIQQPPRQLAEQFGLRWMREDGLSHLR